MAGLGVILLVVALAMLAMVALRGALRRGLGDPDGAAADLERYLQLAPDAPDAASLRAALQQLRGGR